jgi:hypothetical protein
MAAATAAAVGDEEADLLFLRVLPVGGAWDDDEPDTDAARETKNRGEILPSFASLPSSASTGRE